MRSSGGQGCLSGTYHRSAGNSPDVGGQPDSNPGDKGKMKAGSLRKVGKATGEQHSVLLWDSVLTTASAESYRITVNPLSEDKPMKFPKHTIVK